MGRDILFIFFVLFYLHEKRTGKIMFGSILLKRTTIFKRRPRFAKQTIFTKALITFLNNEMKEIK